MRNVEYEAKLDKVIDVISDLTKRGIQDFAIFPYGSWGKKVKEILNDRFNIAPRFCVDNFSYNLVNIFPVDKMPQEKEKCFFLYVMEDGHKRKTLYKQITEYVEEERIVNIFDWSEEVKVIAQKKKVQPIDFLCVAPRRCGLATFRELLSANSEVIFEDEILSSILDKEVYHNSSRDKRKGQINGIVSADFYDRADWIRSIYGDNVKILFLCRNPIEALESWAKCISYARCINNSGDITFVENIHIDKVSHFEKILMENKDIYCYSNYIKFFQDCFSEEQVKIIISEDMFNKPYETLQEVCEFLEIKNERRDEATISRIHKNKYISNESVVDLYNQKVIKVFDNLNKNMITDNDFIDVQKFLIQKSDGKNLQVYMYEKLMEYYKQSVLELEGMLERTLKGTWY